MQCSIFGCSQEVRSRSWCPMHYQIWYRHGDPNHKTGKRRSQSFDFHKAKSEWRQKAMNELGGECLHCGFNNRIALQFDHIDGGGNKERKISRGHRGYSFYRSIALKKRDDIQLLCANCNWIKRYSSGEQTRRKSSFD